MLYSSSVVLLTLASGAGSQFGNEDTKKSVRPHKVILATRQLRFNTSGVAITRTDTMGTDAIALLSFLSKTL